MSGQTINSRVGGGEVEALEVEQALLRNLGQLAVCKLIAEGDFLLITKEQVQELIRMLDHKKIGKLDLEDLLIICRIEGLNITADTVSGIFHDCDADGDGHVTAEELFRGINIGDTGLNKYLSNLRGERKTDGKQLHRSEFLDYLNYQFDKDDACWTLPTTVILFLVYLFMVQSHGNTENQFWIHEAMQGEVAEEGGRSNHEGPFLDRDVHDIPTWWDWAIYSLPSASMKQELPTYPQPGRLGSYNQMFGGLQLRRIKTENTECVQNVWIRDLYRTGDLSEMSCQPMAENMDNFDLHWILYHELVNISQSNLRQMYDDVWISHVVTRVELRGLFLNAQHGFFTVMQLGFDFKRDGFLKIRFDWQSIPSDPYLFTWTYILDALFLFLIFKMAYNECKELIPAMRNGWDGFIDYWGFWNLVDWLSILVALIQFIVWLVITTTVSGTLHPTLSALAPTFENLDHAVRTQQAFLTTEELDQVAGGRANYEAALDEVMVVAESLYQYQSMYANLLATYTGVIIFRFFKSFRANPRLSVVTETLSGGVIDLIHFFVVFMVFFLAFTVIACVIFGPRMKTFRTYAYSAVMCWRILMGDFDVDEMMEVHAFWGVIWFLLFECLVLLILFNMLLAIIMDTYSAVKGAQRDTITIWAQAILMYNQTLETKGFLDLWYLICQFEDDDFPAHPEKLVTSRSLRKAFPKMSRSNADYLIQHALEYLKTEGAAITLTDAIRVIGRMEKRQLELMQEVRLISGHVLSGDVAYRGGNTTLAISDAPRAQCRKCNVFLSPGDLLRGTCGKCAEPFEPSPEPPPMSRPISQSRPGSQERPDSRIHDIYASSESESFRPNQHADNESLQKLAEFMKPGGLIDDRFQSVEIKAERLADLCEEVLHSNLKEREFLDRLDRLENSLIQIRHESVHMIKGVKLTEDIDNGMQELTRTVTSQRTERENILWQVGLDMKNFQQQLLDMKKIQESQFELMQKKLDTNLSAMVTAQSVRAATPDSTVSNAKPGRHHKITPTQ